MTVGLNSAQTGPITMAVDTRPPAADTAHVATEYLICANLVRPLGLW